MRGVRAGLEDEDVAFFEGREVGQVGGRGRVEELGGGFVAKGGKAREGFG